MNEEYLEFREGHLELLKEFNPTEINLSGKARDFLVSSQQNFDGFKRRLYHLSCGFREVPCDKYISGQQVVAFPNDYSLARICKLCPTDVPLTMIETGKGDNSANFYAYSKSLEETQVRISLRDKSNGANRLLSRYLDKIDKEIKHNFNNNSREMVNLDNSEKLKGRSKMSSQYEYEKLCKSAFEDNIKNLEGFLHDLSILNFLGDSIFSDQFYLCATHNNVDSTFPLEQEYLKTMVKKFKRDFHFELKMDDLEAHFNGRKIFDPFKDLL